MVWDADGVSSGFVLKSYLERSFMLDIENLFGVLATLAHNAFAVGVVVGRGSLLHLPEERKVEVIT